MAAPKGNRHGSKYNAKRHEAIIEGLLKGNSRTVSFRLSGCHPDVVFDWLKKGRDNPDTYPEYVSLIEDIEYAEAMVESERVSIVKTAADTGTWQAAAWWLERRKPETWGRNDTVRHEGGETPAIQVNQVILIDADARAASRELLNRVAAGRSAVPVGTRALLEPAEDH